MASSILKIKSKQSKKLSPEQKAFNILNSKIEKLKREKTDFIEELSECLDIYETKIHPIQNKLFEAYFERISFCHTLYQKNRALNKRHKELCREFMILDINQAIIVAPDLSDKVTKLFKIQEALLDYELFEDEDLETLDEEFEVPFKDTYDEPIEIKEKKQPVEIKTLYKKLAKVFHPDRAQSQEEASEKLELMKELTRSYDEGDYTSMLALEIKHLKNDTSDYEALGKEALKSHIKLLKQQAKDIEQSIVKVAFEPRFHVIQKFIMHGFDSPHAFDILANEFKSTLGALEAFHELMQESKCVEYFKVFLDEFSTFDFD